VKIILDMDPGIDDAVALLIALNNPELEVLAVTAANGNVDVNRSTYNVLRIIDAASKEVIVARGASKPLFKRPVHAGHVHGRDGLGNSDLQKPTIRPSSLHAVKLVENLVQTHKKKELTLVATAPLTNVALLLNKEPWIAKKLAKIVLMGGVYGFGRSTTGNVTPYAEFNFYCDPEAADIVLNSGASVIAAGLDVTMNFKCAVGKSMLKKISTLGGRTAEIASKILAYPVFRYEVFHLHDVFAVASLLQPSMFKMVDCMVRVDKVGKFRGRCVTTCKKDHVRICSSVDHQRFVKFVLQGLKQRGS